LYSDAPELLEQAWKSVEQYNDEFLEFFGSDRLTLSGYELNKKLAEFQEKITQKRLDAAGIDRTKSLEELAENAGLSSEELESLEAAIKEEEKVRADNPNKMVQPQIELPAQLKKAERVTVITHPRWGQMFLPTYQKLQDLLSSEGYKNSPDLHKLIRHYLESPEINSFIWQDLANNHPQQLEAVLLEVLERPNFKLERDFNSLMQEYNKPLEPELPEIASVPLHLHTLFQDAVIEVQRSKSKDRVNQKKASKGFQK
jgi:DNA-binding Xre family transcriptional regulator